MSTLPSHKHHLSEQDQAFYIEHETIQAAHPMAVPVHLRETAYSAWNVALVLVGERHEKHDLVDLVGYLMHANMRLNQTLRRQAAAAIAGMDATTRASSIRLELAEKARAESSPDALASERAANALLTEENERLRARVADLESTMTAIAVPNAPAVSIERVQQRSGADLWAVRTKSGCCLNKEGDWEDEPQPSSRDDAFLNRCRFATSREAIDAAIADAARLTD
jgi:hypothetical protein